MRHKKRVRQPHNTAERQRQKAVGRGEYIMDQPPAAAQENGDLMNNGYGNGYEDGRPPPNSIEIRRAYEQQQMQQQQMMNNGPIMTGLFSKKMGFL